FAGWMVLSHGRVVCPGRPAESTKVPCALSTWGGLCLGGTVATQVQWEVAPSSASTGNDEASRRPGCKARRKLMIQDSEEQKEIVWFAGVDWASEKHQACLLDATGKRIGERIVAHGGAGLSDLCDWLLAGTDSQAWAIGVAIETRSGPVVDALLERGFQ